MRPGIGFVGDPAGWVDRNGASGVISGPPRARNQCHKQNDSDQCGAAFTHYWMTPVMSMDCGSKNAARRPCAARIKSQHSRAAPRPPGFSETQCAACTIYVGALG